MDEKSKYLMSLIDFEIKTELHKVDISMKKEHLDKAYQTIGIRRKVDNDFEIEGYWSTCQTIVVAEQFFAFLNQLYQNYTMTDASMAKLGKDCYGQ